MEISNQYKNKYQPFYEEVSKVSNKLKKTVSVNWKPDKNLKTTLVKQIVGYVKEQISCGDWIVGQKLPSQRALAEAFQVNRSTIVEALSELAAQGLIESAVGRGTTITNSSWSLLLENTTPDWKNYIQQGIHKSNSLIMQNVNKYEFDDSVIRLSTCEMSPDLLPTDKMSEVLKNIAEKNIPLNYLEPLGLHELRVELCAYFKRYDFNVKPSQILIVSGSLQALQLISMSILGSDSVVFIEENSYVKSLRVFESSGIKMKGIPMDKNGLMPWMIDKLKVKKGSSILYTIPTFHNPTGITMTEERRAEVIRWCRSNQMPIIESDVYRELYFDKEPPLPIKTMDNTGNVLYLGSVSKSLAPGLRIGWVVGPESIIERLSDVKMQSDYGASSLSQWALTEWFSSGLYEEHLIVLRRKLKERCYLMLQLLDKYFSDIATWDIPDGGFYIWIKLNKPVSSENLFGQALKENILIHPGDIYGFRRNNCIRLSFSYASYEEMEIGLKKLSEVINQIAD